MLSLEISGGSSLFGSTGDSSTVWGLSRTGSLERQDRKSTRLNSSHGYISYAVFCLKKKKRQSVSNFTPEYARPGIFTKCDSCLSPEAVYCSRCVYHGTHQASVATAGV